MKKQEHKSQLHEKTTFVELSLYLQSYIIKWQYLIFVDTCPGGHIIVVYACAILGQGDANDAHFNAQTPTLLPSVHSPS